jgi:hypothetical protein
MDKELMQILDLRHMDRLEIHLMDLLLPENYLYSMKIDKQSQLL